MTHKQTRAQVARSSGRFACSARKSVDLLNREIRDSATPNEISRGGDIRTDAILPGLGITGALVIVIGYLLVANRRDRLAHERAMRQRDTEHAAELVAARAAHDADLAGLAGLRSRLATLERRLGELEAELDKERNRRRAAEDEAAAARRTN